MCSLSRITARTHDERFSLLTASLGKNLSCLLPNWDKSLPSEVVKKENLSSLNFHVHRSNWEICTQCVHSKLFYQLITVQSNPNPFGQLQNSKGSDSHKVQITEIPPLTTPKPYLSSISVILLIDRTTHLCFLLPWALQLAPVAIVHKRQLCSSVHCACANRPHVLILYFDPVVPLALEFR